MAERDDTELSPMQPESTEPRSESDEPEGDRAEHDIVRQHLTRAWQSWAPAPDLDARVRARLTSSSAATMGALGLGAANSAGRPGAWASLQATGKLGALMGAGLLGVGFLSGYFTHSSLGPGPSTEPPRATAPALTGAVAPRDDVSGEVAPAVVQAVEARETSEARGAPHDDPAGSAPQRAVRAAPSAAAVSHAAASPAPASNSASSSAATARPNEELALLQRAERAVRADNAALALALIGELDARYPHSTLLEERSAIELLAYCRAGATNASSRAARFLRQHPQSLYAGRIRELCPPESEGPAPER